ncbi:MAG: nucleotidyltransferase family protein [Devosia sp.]|nr:nucleotidyltransferase family protein [Devosia sp.]
MVGNALQDLALCLAFANPEAELSALRARLRAGGWLPLIELARDLRLLPAIATAAGAKRLTAGLPAFRLSNGQTSIPALLADALAQHRARSAAMLARLEELVDLFTRNGIEPILLKGARALWTGEPDWRTLRDLDLLVLAPEADRAQALAIAAGYRTSPDYDLPLAWHHGADLYRPDLPGWLEIHSRAGMYRADLVLPTGRLAAAAIPLAGRHGATALALPAPRHVLHCLVHHHIGHRADKFGTLDIKGLYEFAADVAALDAPGREELFGEAGRHPRLLAMTELWIAAAADLFRLEAPAPFVLDADGRNRWRAIARRAATGDPPGNYDGLLEEAGMALSANRLRRLPGGNSLAGRLRLRLRVMRSLLAPATTQAERRRAAALTR